METEQMKNEKNNGVNKKQIVKGSNPVGYRYGIFGAIREDKIDYVFLFLVSSCFLGFGIYHLGQFFVTDEIVWVYKRYPMYWMSFLDGGWGRFEDFGAQSGILQILLSAWVFFTENIQACDYSNFESFLFKWRLPLLLFNYFLLFLIFDRVRRLWGNRIAVTSIVLISFFPFLLGISQIFNKDTTLWSTAIVSILNFFLYLKTKQYRFAIHSGIFLGLALLSKFPASILYPVYFGFIYLEYLLQNADRASFIHALKAYTVCIGISMFIVFIALPPSWGNLRWLLDWTWYSQVIDKYTNYIFLVIVLLSFEIMVLKGVISKKVNSYSFLKTWIPKILFGIFFVCLCIMAIIQLLNIENHFEFLNREIGARILIHNFPRAFCAGFLNIVKGSPLIHLFGIFGFLILMLKNTKRFAQIRFFFYSMVLIMIYYVGSALAGAELSLRYQIILLPIFCIFASYFFVAVFKRRFYVYLTIFVIILTGEMAYVAPFYISYRNPIELSSFINPGVSWGQGGYEVAQFANRLENAGEMKILSDYEGFSEFFKGAGFRYKHRRKLTENYIVQYDYLCLSSSGYRQIMRHKHMTQDLKKYYDQPLESSLSYIGNEQSYVKLVRID